MLRPRYEIMAELFLTGGDPELRASRDYTVLLEGHLGLTAYKIKITPVLGMESFIKLGVHTLALINLRSRVSMEQEPQLQKLRTIGLSLPMHGL